MSEPPSNGHPGATPAPATPLLGVVEWFRVGEHERAERVLGRMAALGIKELRTPLSWADWCRPEGQAWYDWLFPTLKRRVNVLPCIVRTPPHLASAASTPPTAAPPREVKAYADFIDIVISRYGEHFEAIEFWNEPNQPGEWDRALDPEWESLSAMIAMATHWARRCGKRTVLAGTWPPDPAWLALMGRRRVLEQIDAVGIHGFPGACDAVWHGWQGEIARVRNVLHAHGSRAEVWITGAGYSTWRRDEGRQLAAFLDAIAAPVHRVYWYAVEDMHPDSATSTCYHADEREYHFGLWTSDDTGGRPKLLARCLARGGLDAARRAADVASPVPTGRRTRLATLITGGAGFIGTNLADRLLSQGRPVIIYDTLSRPGVERNAEYLKDRYGDRVELRVEDVRDGRALASALRHAVDVFHFAAQVAVTTSLDDPVSDMGVNLAGTVTLLEEVRRLAAPVPVVFTSTNKVYGNLSDVEFVAGGKRYEPADPSLRAHGVGEDRPLHFCSPYGCSKGAADQYVLDYAASYGLPTAVFRMSCIYGPHQCGNEDQGWVAHFLRAAAAGEGLTVYGDGRQVRDILYVDDLVNALLLCREHIARLAGRAFNIGGGPRNTVSLLECFEAIAELNGSPPLVAHGPWRAGDQRWYVSDTRAFHRATAWTPAVRAADGIARLHRWLGGRSLPIPILTPAPSEAATR